jgi:hypothetical protein
MKTGQNSNLPIVIRLDNVKTFPTNPNPLTNLKWVDDNSIDGVDCILLEGNYALTNGKLLP